MTKMLHGLLLWTTWTCPSSWFLLLKCFSKCSPFAIIILQNRGIFSISWSSYYHWPGYFWVIWSRSILCHRLCSEWWEWPRWEESSGWSKEPKAYGHYFSPWSWPSQLWSTFASFSSWSCSSLPCLVCHSSGMPKFALALMTCIISKLSGKHSLYSFK